MNALVGKDGAEFAFESYLHGQDGTATITSTADGTVTNTVYTKEPKPGDQVYLTIDETLQEASENALAKGIEQLKADKAKEDAKTVRLPTRMTRTTRSPAAPWWWWTSRPVNRWPSPAGQLMTLQRCPKISPSSQGRFKPHV